MTGRFQVGKLGRRISWCMGLIAVLLLCPGILLAANHYIRAGAAGSATGADWTNAWTDLPTTFVRGDTYYVADGTYGSHVFNTALSGATYIYIKKAITSDHGTDTGWISMYGDGTATFDRWTFNTGYYFIDGQFGSGEGSYGFTVRPATCGTNVKTVDSVNGAAYVTIRYTELTGCGEDRVDSADDILYLGRATNWTISHCYLHDTNRTAVLFAGGCQNNVIEYSSLCRRHSNGTTHGEGLSTVGTNNNNILRYNRWYDFQGTGYVVIQNGTNSGWQIYSNAFYATNPQRYDVSNGIITTCTGDTATNMRVYNNTFANIITVSDRYPWPVNWNETTGNVFINNLCWNTIEPRNVATRSHNLYNNSTYASNETNGQYYSAAATSLFVNFSNYDFRLNIATNQGYSLPSPYNVDITGSVYGADGTWDRGAYEFGAGSSAGIPSAPQNLRVVAN